jgi:oligopeptide/dipeptide ABC transporter ATP-binding protein
MSDQDPYTQSNLIDVVGLKKYFPIRAGLLKRLIGNVRAVDDVSFYIKKGETLGVVGESGCGKTTVGRSMMMLTTPTSGYVFYEAPKSVVEDFRKLDSLRRKIKRVADSREIDKEAAVEMADVINRLLGTDSCDIRADKKKNICRDAVRLKEALENASKDSEISSRIQTILRLSEETISEVANRYCINYMPKGGVRRIRSRIQFVFQDPFSSLDPRMLVKDIISEPLRSQLKLEVTDRTIRNRKILFATMVLGSALLIASEWLSIFSDYNADVIQPLISRLYSVLYIGIAGALMWWSLMRLNTASDIMASILIEMDGGLRQGKPPGIRGRGNWIRKETILLMEKVGLNIEHLYRFPHEFSGGQRQRIGIARALSVNPAFVVLDEPTSALDVSVQAQILNMLNDLQRDFGFTYMFISHDLSTIRYMCDRVAVMYLGKIVESAPKSEIFAHPTHPYTEALLSVIPVPDPEIRKDRIILTGDVPSPANPPSGCRFHTRCQFAIPVCSIEEPALVDYGNEHFVACHVRKEIVK